jgi:hypothetical protein
MACAQREPQGFPKIEQRFRFLDMGSENALEGMEVA